MGVRVYSGELPKDTPRYVDRVRYVFRAHESDLGEVDQLLRGGGLFAEARHVVLYDFLNQSDAYLFVKQNINAWLEAGHEIELREEKLLAEQKRFLQNISAMVHEYKPTPKPKDTRVFAVTDAILERDVRRAWIAYREALGGGKQPEEIAGLVWWQLKTLWLVAKLGARAGQSPHATRKAAQALKKYSPREIAGLSRSFVANYHKARLGVGPELEGALESWILTL